MNRDMQISSYLVYNTPSRLPDPFRGGAGGHVHVCLGARVASYEKWPHLAVE